MMAARVDVASTVFARTSKFVSTSLKALVQYTFMKVCCKVESGHSCNAVNDIYIIILKEKEYIDKDLHQYI